MRCYGRLTLRISPRLFKGLRRLLTFALVCAMNLESVLLVTAARYRARLGPSHCVLVSGLPVGSRETDRRTRAGIHRKLVPGKPSRRDGSGPTPGPTSWAYCVVRRRGRRSATVTGSRPPMLRGGPQLTPVQRPEMGQWPDGLPRVTRARSQPASISYIRAIAAPPL